MKGYNSLPFVAIDVAVGYESCVVMVPLVEQPEGRARILSQKQFRRSLYARRPVNYTYYIIKTFFSAPGLALELPLYDQEHFLIRGFRCS